MSAYNDQPALPTQPSAHLSRRRREPPFGLEADDLTPPKRPPAPLRPLIGDVEDELPRFADTRVREMPWSSGTTRDRRSVGRLSRSDAQAATLSRPPVEQPEVGDAARPTRRNSRSAFADPDSTESNAPAAGAIRRLSADRSAVHWSFPGWFDTGYGLELLRPPAGLDGRMKLVLAAVVSLLIIVALGDFGGGTGRPALMWPGSGATSQRALTATVRPAGDYRVQGPPSLTPQQIDRILKSYGSPAAGTGQIWYDLGVKYGIDPAFAVAFFIHESGAGTSPNWAGLKPDGSTTHNIGNIICAGYPTCYGRFRDYRSWAEGIEDWYRLIAVEYIRWRGASTVDEIVPIYAPAFENDVQGYIDTIKRLVDEWRTFGVR